MSRGRVVVLSGGVGGAKLALGLSRVLEDEELLVVVNTADDFHHLGLPISPDIDTLVYTLADLADRERGWGRQDESWNFMKALTALGGEDWFNLGDGDLAMHVHRRQRLVAGQGLAEVTDEIRHRLGISARIAPMSDDPVATIVETLDGPLSFQDYFVRQQCKPVATGFRFEGIAQASPNPEFLAALADPATRTLIIAPSNPLVSIDPILNLPGVDAALRAFKGAIIAVSPIVGGVAIKGPAAKMMTELGMPASAAAVARHYGDLLDGFVIDTSDGEHETEIASMGAEVLVTQTVMRDLADREALAHDCMAFAHRIWR